MNSHGTIDGGSGVVGTTGLGISIRKIGVRATLAAAAVACGLLWLSAGAAFATGPVTYTHGVASGDVTDSAAILWTRIDSVGDIDAQVSTDPGFGSFTTYGPVTAAAADDFTAKIDATSLSADTLYYYRWRHDNVGTDQFSPVGQFTTAPSSATAADLSFSYTADNDATTTNVVAPFPQTFDVFNLIDTTSPLPDFFLYLGDTIYSDSGLRANLPDPPGPGPATTVAEYRDAYKEVRSVPNTTDLLADVSTYVSWDDHEVQNDYDGQTVSQARYDAGREAFLEYMPIRESTLLTDPDCGGTGVSRQPLYRTFKWGTEVELFLLDERSCRSDHAAALAACPGIVQGVDAIPTFPSNVRGQFPFSVFGPPSPPAGCLSAVNDSSRTVLGSVQKAQFKSDLLSSTAKHKFVVNEYPIQQWHVLPFDRWEGYPAERNELLNYIRDNDVGNVVFLTTDTHANLVDEVAIDRFADSRTTANEVVTGPIGTNTLETEIFSIAGQFAVDSVNTSLGYSGTDCRDLDKYSYGLIDVDAAGGTADLTLTDDASANVTNQVAPAVSCNKTFPAPKIQVMDWDVTGGDAIVSVGDIGGVVTTFGAANAPFTDLNDDGFVSVGDIGAVVLAFGLNEPATNLAEGRTIRLYMRGSGQGTLNWSATDLPAGATFNTTTREFAWMPSSTQSGDYRVTFNVTDDNGTESETIVIKVLDTL